MSSSNNEIGSVEPVIEEKSMGDQTPKGEKNPEETKRSTLKDNFNKLIHWNYSPTIVAVLVILGDVYLFWSRGISTGISALAAEGTLTLALVTYIQMKSAQQRYPP